MVLRVHEVEETERGAGAVWGDHEVEKAVETGNAEVEDHGVEEAERNPVAVVGDNELEVEEVC